MRISVFLDFPGDCSIFAALFLSEGLKTLRSLGKEKENLEILTEFVKVKVNKVRPGMLIYVGAFKHLREAVVQSGRLGDSFSYTSNAGRALPVLAGQRQHRRKLRFIQCWC